MAKQFVVEAFMKNSRTWVPSGNQGLTWPFSTESEAQAAIDQNGSRGMDYRIVAKEVADVPAVAKEKEKCFMAKGKAKRHTKRFIIMVKVPNGGSTFRSANAGLRGFFLTKEEALAAIAPERDLVSGGLKYSVRQK